MPKEISHIVKPSYDEIVRDLKKAQEMRNTYKAQWLKESKHRVHDKDLLRAEIDACKEAHESDKQIFSVFSECLARVDANLLRAKQRSERYRKMSITGWIGFYILAVVIILIATFS
jgi:hypothetical protein